MVSIILTFHLRLILRQFLSHFHKDYLTTKITLTIKNSSLGVLDTTLCDKVCQWLAAGQWFSPGFSTNKTDCHVDDITEILLKGALNTINYIPLQPRFIFIEQCLCIAFNIIWTTISQKSGPIITDSLREYTRTKNFFFENKHILCPIEHHKWQEVMMHIYCKSFVKSVLEH